MCVFSSLRNYTFLIMWTYEFFLTSGSVFFYASQGHGESVDRVRGKFSVAVHMPFFDVLRRVLDT